MCSAEKNNISFRSTLPFLIPALLLLSCLGVALLCIPKGELHLLLCQPHTLWLDAIVPTFSNLVDWLPYLTVVVLLFYRAGWSLFLASNLLLSTLIVQPIKHLLRAPRPLVWFADNMPDAILPIVDGVKMNHWYSFPSGHTTTFFVLFFTLSLVVMNSKLRGKKFYSIVFFLLAVFGAYTRIYLSQHFAVDIFGGILVAITTTLLLYFFYAKRLQNTRFWHWNPQKLKK